MAYGVVVYACSCGVNGERSSALVFSKARVAPLKGVSVPRLELAAAALAARMYGILRVSLSVKSENVTFWTDSMIVLYYIENLSTRFCTYVANRVAAIHDVSEPKQWKHVASKENPADYASRGFYDLREASRW